MAWKLYSTNEDHSCDYGIDFYNGVGFTSNEAAKNLLVAKGYTAVVATGLSQFDYLPKATLLLIAAEFSVTLEEDASKKDIVAALITAFTLNASLASLEVGALSLTPAFDGAVLEYTAATTNATDIITVVPADAKSTVEILNGETAVENGAAATWAEGANIVTVTVTNGDLDPVVYTVTVTKTTE